MGDTSRDTPRDTPRDPVHSLGTQYTALEPVQALEPSTGPRAKYRP